LLAGDQDEANLPLLVETKGAASERARVREDKEL